MVSDKGPMLFYALLQRGSLLRKAHLQVRATKEDDPLCLDCHMVRLPKTGGFHIRREFVHADQRQAPYDLYERALYITPDGAIIQR